MRKRVQIALAVLVVAVVGVIGWQISRVREPVYQGKRLTVWLEQYSTYHISGDLGGGLDEQAGNAIRQIGTNPIPIYLEMITASESPVKRTLMTKVPNRWRPWFQRRGVEQNRMLGAQGFIALGEKARPYVPALMTSLRHKNLDVCRVAGFALIGLGPAASAAVPTLVDCLDDPSFRLKDVAPGCLGAIHQEPERVVPALARLVANHRADTTLRLIALESLSKFGAPAKAAVPTLVALLDDQDAGIRARTTNALKAIDPEAAAKAEVK